jgi:cytochrome c peroxidase
MHDGKKGSLEEVLRHYASEMQVSPNLDPVFLRPDGTAGIDLSEQDQADIIAFLKTLDDEEFVRNRAFSEQ